LAWAAIGGSRVIDLPAGNFLARIYWADVHKDNKREAARFERAASLLFNKPGCVGLYACL